MGWLPVAFLMLSPSLAWAAPTIPAPRVIAGRESARYRVTYGVLGDLGEITLDLVPVRTALGLMGARVHGAAQGSLAGMGHTEKRIDAEMSLKNLGPSRWTAYRLQGGQTIVDTIEQAEPGVVTLTRRRDGGAAKTESLKREQMVMDPISFLVRLRLSPPQAEETFEVLDGRALWLFTMRPARHQPAPSPGKGLALRLDGRAEPIFWDGRPDADRTARGFTLWLADDNRRTPFLLTLDVGLGQVRAGLVAVAHPDEQPSFLRRFSLAYLARGLALTAAFASSATVN